MEKIIIYTDGSSRGNPGPGGWGAIIISEAKSASKSGQVTEIGGREEKTTNNRMEMKAAIEALAVLNPNSQIEIFTDSEYLLNGITKWINGWLRNNWRTKDKREVLNKDLWQKLFELTEDRNIKWKKVAGHSGHVLNERCDRIATSFADEKKIGLYNGLKQGYFAFH